MTARIHAAVNSFGKPLGACVSLNNMSFSEDRGQEQFERKTGCYYQAIMSWVGYHRKMSPPPSEFILNELNLRARIKIKIEKNDFF
ncbi:MAG: hypothetical protein M1169_03050 [Firmicutes bacterium]|nr:hypothetical protein [Bacillota bacterium]